MLSVIRVCISHGLCFPLSSSFWNPRHLWCFTLNLFPESLIQWGWLELGQNTLTAMHSTSAYCLSFYSLPVPEHWINCFFPFIPLPHTPRAAVTGSSPGLASHIIGSSQGQETHCLQLHVPALNSLPGIIQKMCQAGTSVWWHNMSL